MSEAATYHVHEIDAAIGGILADKTTSREVAFLKLCEFEKSLGKRDRHTFSVVTMTRLCGLVIGLPPAATPEIITPKENHHEHSAA